MVAGQTLAEIKEQGHFRVPIKFDSESHLYSVDISLGNTEEDLKNSFTCILDMSVPTVIVPHKNCGACEGRRFDPNEHGEPQHPSDRTGIKWPRKLMYWEYTDGYYIMDEEQWPLTMNYRPQFQLREQIHFPLFEFFSIKDES